MIVFLTSLVSYLFLLNLKELVNIGVVNGSRSRPFGFTVRHAHH